jgi:hypothetical protein
MKKSIILFQILPLMVFSQIYQQKTYKNIYLLLLIDSSGSLKTTDPEEIRKLAAQSIIPLLSKEDKVAVMEFDSEARILSLWKSSEEKQEIFEAINKVSNEGKFTDFIEGLENAFSLFQNVPKESRRIILLLSDGIFEPNLSSEKYAPYHLQYSNVIRGKKGEEKKKIEKEYHEKILPVANRIIETEILPKLKKENIEIFTIAFSQQADKEFLRYLSEETKMISNEIHNFYAEKPTDLVETFVKFLSYWENLLILYQDSGEIKLFEEKDIFLDEFLKSAFCIVFVDKESEFEIKKENLEPEPRIPGTHKRLLIFPIINLKEGAGRWKYCFKKGEGKYKILILGESNIEMIINGLENKYLYGDTIKISIYLKSNDKNALSFLGPEPKIVSEILWEKTEEEIIREKEIKLNLINDHFELKYSPSTTGTYRIKFILFAKNRNGFDLLPRPSKEYKFEIMPHLYVEPSRINFGNLKQGKIAKGTLNVYSSYKDTLLIKIDGKIIKGSRCIEKKENLPFIHKIQIPIKPFEINKVEIALEVPKKGCWGDYEGEMYFYKDTEKLYTTYFRVHIPSFWEKLTLPFKIIIIIFPTLIFILIGILCCLWILYIQSFPSPSGILQFLATPQGQLIPDLRLSEIRRNFIRRIIRRNVVSIGSREMRCDIQLDNVSGNRCIELIFHHYASYIRNSTRPTGKQTDNIEVTPQGLQNITLQPQQSYELNDNTELNFDGYKIIYIRPR